MNRHKEEQFLKSTNIEIDSLDILQELFGINDKLIKVIENRLGAEHRLYSLLLFQRL